MTDTDNKQAKYPMIVNQLKKHLMGDSTYDTENMDFDIEEILESMEVYSDFTYEDYRYISSEAIFDILVVELADPEIIGYFNSSFLAELLDIPEEIVESTCQADKGELIGSIIIQEGLVGKLAEEYIRIDGYGHHFAHYDGNCLELMSSPDQVDWYMFKID